MSNSEKLPISLVVITLNEERNLARCLAAADFCAEIVVVDSGSVDGTRDIAESFRAKFVVRNWTGYGDQKNYGNEIASQPWVLCIDADEVVSQELRSDIQRQFRSDPSLDGFEINRHSYYSGRLINHSGWYPQWRMFLYRKGKAIWGGTEPHTTVIFRGERSARLKGDLYHHTYSSIRHHMAKLVQQAHDGAHAMRNAGRTSHWWDIVLRPLWAVTRAFVFERGFLDGFYGLVISASCGYYTFLKYSMLREMHTNSEDRSALG